MMLLCHDATVRRRKPGGMHPAQGDIRAVVSWRSAGGIMEARQGWRVSTTGRRICRQGSGIEDETLPELSGAGVHASRSCARHCLDILPCRVPDIHTFQCTPFYAGLVMMTIISSFVV